MPATAGPEADGRSAQKRVPSAKRRTSWGAPDSTTPVAAAQPDGGGRGRRRASGPRPRTGAGGAGEEQGRPPQVVVQRDHHVDGHDDGEPAQARVDGGGEDRDLGEQPDDARRQPGEAEQEEGQRQRGERPGGVQAAVVGEAAVRRWCGRPGRRPRRRPGSPRRTSGRTRPWCRSRGPGRPRRRRPRAVPAGSRPGRPRTRPAAGRRRARVAGRLAQGGDVADGHGERGEDRESPGPRRARTGGRRPR